MSILSGFKNPWESGGQSSGVTNTAVLENTALENNILSFNSRKTDENMFVARIHGSWWKNRISKYTYGITPINEEQTNKLIAQWILEVIILGSVFIHKENINDEILAKRMEKGITESKAREDELKYRTSNWGRAKDYPIMLTTSKQEKLKSLSVNDIIKMVDKTGEFRIKMGSDAHDSVGNNISHKPHFGDPANLGTLIVKKREGFADTMTGHQYWSSWFVMNSPFGKMFRHIGQYEDPWTGELIDDTDKMFMTLDGVLDLLTLGTNLTSGIANQALNVAFEAINKSQYSFEEEGILREMIDITMSIYGLIPKKVNGKYLPMDYSNKYAIIEIVANLIQLGLITYQNGKFKANSKKDIEHLTLTKFVKEYKVIYEY